MSVGINREEKNRFTYMAQTSAIQARVPATTSGASSTSFNLFQSMALQCLQFGVCFNHLNLS
jgi:hypothetical protein